MNVSSDKLLNRFGKSIHLFCEKDGPKEHFMEYRSARLRDRGLTEAYLKATGMIEEEFDRPLILVMNSWNELHPGHMHLRAIADAVKAGVRLAGGVPFESNTIALCDGIRTPASNKYVLPSREIIVDSIETTAETFQADGMVLIASCDKIEPACLMAAARVNIPTVIVSGGAMLAGTVNGHRATNADMNTAGGGYRDGVKLTRQEMSELTESLCGTPGGCWGMGTANTMACLIEAIGMSLPGCACAHAVDSAKYRLAKRSGMAVVELVQKNLRPADIMTEAAFENCVTVNEAIGGSTNSFMHIPAIAHEMGVDFPIERFDVISARTPQLVAVMPSGPYYMSDLRDAGGMQAVMKELEPLLHTEVRTVTGRTLAENFENAKNYNDEVIRPMDRPFHPTGSHAVLKGNLAPQGCVIKKSATPECMMEHRGPARVFETCEGAMSAIRGGEIQAGDVIVIRYEGPKGGPGMREMVDITRTLSSIGCEDKVALITDGRFSGYSSGAVFGHVSPEAQEGGPIAVIRDGDMIRYSIPERSIELEVSAEEIRERLKAWRPKEIQFKGYLRRYANLVSSGCDGAVMK